MALWATSCGWAEVKDVFQILLVFLVQISAEFVRSSFTLSNGDGIHIPKIFVYDHLVRHTSSERRLGKTAEYFITKVVDKQILRQH